MRKRAGPEVADAVTAVATGFPDNAWLQAQAGSGAFTRGKDYHARGRVMLDAASEVTLSGQALGSETYRLWMRQEAGDWDWNCECPAADGGAFCKHLVAAVLSARDGAASTNGKRRRGAAAADSDTLREFLQAQPQQRLAEWLHRLSLQEPEVDRFLHLQRAAEQPEEFKAVLAKLLAAGSFLDYRRSMAFARRLDPALAQLRTMLSRDPDGCMALCEYAFKRLARLIERCDDSAGAIGDRMREVGELHAACADAGASGKGFAARLDALQGLDQWGFLPLARYWSVLDAREQAAYAKKVLDAFEALPAPRTGRAAREWDGEAADVCARTEALARCSGDFDLLQRVLRRDLSHPYQHLRVLESLRQAGREREALAWAETAVKCFPEDDRLRRGLADCLAAAGLAEDAIEQDWQLFRQHPEPGCWAALKRRAGSNWPAWRERALAYAESLEEGHATLRINLLLHDGDLAAASDLARQHPALPGVLLEVARRVRATDPALAGSLYLRVAGVYAGQLNSSGEYLRLVDCLTNAAGCIGAEQWQPLVHELRQQHARKTRLIRELDAAGLR